MSLIIYIKYRLWRLKTELRRAYNYPEPAIWLFILLTSVFISWDYYFLAGVTLLLAFFYYFLCDYLKGNHIHWYRQRYNYSSRKSKLLKRVDGHEDIREG
jgi:hypothetical protein